MAMKMIERIRVQENGSLFIQSVRAGWPKLMVAEAFKGGEGVKKFSCSSLFHKRDDAELITWMQAYIVDFAQANKLATLAPDKICFRDGKYADAELEDFWILSAAEEARPIVMDPFRNLIESEGVIKGGTVINVVINLWAQNNGYGKRINANLRGVQYVRQGDPIANGQGGEAAVRAAADCFSVLSSDVDLGI